MSTLITQTVQSSTSSAPVFKNSSGTEKGQLATAWINFDGRFSDGIRDDFNISSFTELTGDGRYTVTFDNAMANTNYCVVSSGHYIKDDSQSGNVGNAREMGAYILTTTNFKLVVTYNGATTQDAANIFCAVFGGN